MNNYTDVALEFERWNNALQTGCPETVAKLYHKSAILLPTISNKMRTNIEEIEDYFEIFLPLKPQGKVISSNTRVVGDIGINSGICQFNLEGQGEVQARYTFVYQWIDKRWQIIEHHSSRMPEAVS